MADDLANSWGITLCVKPRTNRNPNAIVPGDNVDFQRLKQEVRATFGDAFHLVKIATCGSDANLFACVESTGGDLSRTIVACGSYVAGTDFGLQNWSTSDFETQYGPAVINQPQLVTDQFARTHTVALPYHIPGVMKTEDVEELEDRCLHELHIRCLSARLNNAPVKTLLMELLLAGNGATLSDRALERIASLARMHDFSVTLDEIFTGGRSGTMLMVEQKPHSFRSAVRFVTMGKWIGAGLVLATKQQYLQISANQMRVESGPRGTSTKIDCYYPLLVWKVIRDKLILTQGRRETVLRKLNIPVGEDWGCGVMIYCSKARTDSGQGLKNRFLPMLENVQVDSFRVVNKKEEWSKEQVNSVVVQGVLAWADNRQSIIDDNDLARAIDIFVEQIASPNQRCGNTFLKKDFSHFFPDSTEGSAIRQVAKKAVEKCVLDLKRKGKKCVETFIIQQLAILPWLHGDEAELTRSTFPREFGAPYPNLFGGGIHLVGERVAYLENKRAKINIDDDTQETSVSKRIHFGSVTQYNPAKRTEKESWYIRWDHQDDDESEKVSLDLLQQLLSQYNCKIECDRYPNRFDGHKVAKILNGCQMMFGYVKECDECNGKQQFKIKYDDSQFEEWVSESEVRNMRKLWKKHHVSCNNNISFPSTLYKDKNHFRDRTNHQMS